MTSTEGMSSASCGSSREAKRLLSLASNQHPLAVQVLDWALGPIRDMWTSPEWRAAVESPAAFQQRYLPLQGRLPSGALHVRPRHALLHAAVQTAPTLLKPPPAGALQQHIGSRSGGLRLEGPA